MKIDDYKNVTDRIEIREKCREEIINMSVEKNSKKHRWTKKRFIPVVAVALIGVTAMTAAFADDVISVFSKADAKKEVTAQVADGSQQKVDKSDQLNYSELEKHSHRLNESCETDGLKIKAESSFCDGENMCIIFTAENTNPEIENGYHMLAKGVTVEINGEPFTSTNMYDEIWVDMICDYEGASTYTGTLQFPIPKKSRFTDTAEVKVKIGLFEMVDAWENEGVSFKGAAEFFVNVTADTSSNRVNENVYLDENNGIKIGKVKSTPYAVSVSYKTPENISTAMLVYDENDNQLELNLDNQGDYDGHYQTHNFSSTDSDLIKIVFVDKNTDDLEVVSSFEIPLE